MSLPPSWAGWSAILCVVGLNLTVADVESRRGLVARISLLQFGVNAEQILALRKVMMREGRPDVESRSFAGYTTGPPHHQPIATVPLLGRINFLSSFQRFKACSLPAKPASCNYPDADSPRPLPPHDAAKNIIFPENKKHQQRCPPCHQKGHPIYPLAPPRPPSKQNSTAGHAQWQQDRLYLLTPDFPISSCRPCCGAGPRHWPPIPVIAACRRNPYKK